LIPLLLRSIYLRRLTVLERHGVTLSMTSNAGIPDGVAPQQPQEVNELGDPQKWRHLRALLVANGWREDRISGSHYVFVKPGQRCIPLACHGSSIAKRYAKMVLQLTQTIPSYDDAYAILDAFDEAKEEKTKEESSMENITTMKQGQQTSSSSSSPKEETLHDSRERNPIISSAPMCLTEVTELEKLHSQTPTENRNEKTRTEKEQLLDLIPTGGGNGNYTALLWLLIADEKPHLVGNAKADFRLTSDLIFFQLVNLMDRAFDEYPFNSR
jgi:predicted RNA binding protein YcfA (HicA-like mRNA interferase family)